MPPSRNAKNYTPLEIYMKNVSKNRKSFLCPHCKTSLLPEQYEKHCSYHHHLNPRLCCVWCRGGVSWKGKKKKIKHADHLLSCFHKFMKLDRVQPPPQISDNFTLPQIPDNFTPSQIPDNFTPPVKPGPVPFGMKPMAQKKSLFDYVFHPPFRAYDPVWPMPLDPNLLTFEHDSLDKAVSCVRKYLELGSSVEWFHVMVQTPAFPGFLSGMDADEGRSRTLPFSCWCDGGQPEEPQHRHMIVVSSPPGHFVRDVWEKINFEYLPLENFKCLHYRFITSAMQLVNTIGYLCQRESRCDFFSEYNKRLPEKLIHFYLFESLPRDYRLPLVMQWEGGLLELLDRNFKNLKRVELLRSIMSFFERKWQFKIKDIPGIDLNTVLPVTQDFQPCQHETQFFLHLTGSRKLHFERNPDLQNLTRRAWLKEQADKGNLFFYFIAGPENGTPRPYDRGLINAFKPVIDRNRKLEMEIARLKETCRKNHEPLEEEVARWKRKHEDSEQEIKSLLEKTNEEDIAKLKLENEELKQELARVKRPRISLEVT